MTAQRSAVIFAAILNPMALPPTPGTVLAAPGDCAHPIGEFVTQTVYGQSAGVAGPASDHFAPRSATDSVTALLPIELTRRVDTTLTGVAGVCQRNGGRRGEHRRGDERRRLRCDRRDGRVVDVAAEGAGNSSETSGRPPGTSPIRSSGPGSATVSIAGSERDWRDRRDR